jgi:hypothetical protein
MIPRVPYEYAIVRFVPSVEREEFVNAGVILFCKAHRFLAARVFLDEARLSALAPGVDLTLVREELDLIPRIAAGDPVGGSISRLPQAERFRWLAAPRSTMLQLSPVHAGLCPDPAAALEELFARLVCRTQHKPPGL